MDVFSNDAQNQKSKFVRLIKRARKALRIELLQFFTFEEIVKFALICRETYKFVDPNRGKIDTDKNMEIVNISSIGTPQLSLHFAWIMSVHK